MESEVLVKVILLLNWTIFCCTAEQQLNLLVLEPIPNPPLPSFYHPSYAEGPALFLAAELAAEMVNRNSSILQGYHLNLLREDSGCTVPFRAMDAFAKPLLSSVHASPIVGVIGPTCSLSALTVSSLSGRSEIALINIPLAGTHRLEDRKEHPYSFSILDSSRLIARAIVALTQSNDWGKVALFYDTSRQYFLSVVQMVGDESNHSMEPVGISLTDLSPLHSIRNKFRIIILLVSKELLSGIMCFAHTEGYTYPAYQYIVSTEVIEAVSEVEFKVGSKSYRCKRDEVRRTLNGSLLVKHQVERPGNELHLVTESGISLEEFKEMYNESFHSSDLLHANESMPSLFGAIIYDAVWSFVLALNTVMANTDIRSYSFGQPNVTNLIAEKLVGSVHAFEGLSGRIQFNETTGHIDQNAQFFVINEVGITELSYYQKESNNITLYNSSLIPETIFISDSFQEVILTVPKPLTYFILVLNIFGFILTAVLNIGTCTYRHVDSVKASSINLIQVAFIGCYIHALSLLFAVLIYGFSDSINEDAMCNIQHLLDFSLSIGLTVLLGAICMRVWRLHRIFNRFANPGKLLSDRYLILSIASLVSIDLALTIPAFFASKYEPMAEEKRADNVIWKIITCKRSHSTHFFLWFMSSLAVSAVLLSIIFVLAVLTRKIPQRNFKTTSIMYLSYTLTAVVPFILGVYFTFSCLSGYVSMVLRFCALCLLLLCLILILCAMLFFPPLLPVLKRKKCVVSNTVKHHASFSWYPS